ncbi:MAG: aspartyl/asparaginyl beta-hydroxylase domain-containing protein [Rhodanobacteraceae bacterium]|nr:aspartyl/asparaginyl beta-hydroxylase domain-containing protein [Rhodanobacteraceae bacterium]
MKIQYPFLQLPLLYDAEALSAEIEALGESVWRPHPQGFAGNSALPLIAAHGDPASDSVRGPMRPTPHLERLPYLHEVLASFGAVLGRSRLMRLSGSAEVTAHVDVDYYWRDHIRIHVPVVTQPEVTFFCGPHSLHMKAGECWIFDTWAPHRVINSATSARIHIVADTVGGEGFWRFVSASRTPDYKGPWTASRTPPGAAHPPLRCESTNLPAVMTPWELREQITFVLDEAVPDTRLNEIHRLASDLARDWRALWACYGESREGWAEYRARMQQFMHEVLPSADSLSLRNGVRMMRALSSLIALVAVADQRAAGEADERSAPL